MICKEIRLGGYGGECFDSAFRYPHDPSVQEGLVNWCRHGHSRRGLELKCNKRHASERIICKHHAIKCVLEEQRRQKLLRINDPTALSTISEKYTRSARKFALIVGVADAIAVPRVSVSKNSARHIQNNEGRTIIIESLKEKSSTPLAA
eukprot:CAMPEP_0195508518 /NCGR_PEP_ID=MMETSP0794_2-20130614/1711_1 /TAXON_ID=515487 /ORGANISM="Stephanopyxis turris, Strain CCMP 815" /LENGTH=148 /DNA_ID=CAMNT_0040635507 /DNA_START=328 /DNA_END=774 /DNA_ORIENTATION=+